jgi:hypothetical protein
MPELMSIGDSGYNGVRSLTIDQTLAGLAAPAQVAAAFGWDFSVPTYPDFMLADLEATLLALRDGEDPLEALPGAALTNANGWLSKPTWSAEPVFHNLAIAQLMTADLLQVNYAAAIANATALARPGLGLADLPGLYEAINTAFILNPTQDKTRGALTPIDILAEQKPKRLLVHTGPNDGLWTLLLMADPTNFQALYAKTAWENLSAALAKCPEIEHIYVNLLPRPRTIANLIPVDPADVPGAGGYFKAYKSALLNDGQMTGAQLAQIDQYVLDTANPGIRQAFAPLGPKIHFVDLYAMTARNDAKHLAEAPADRIMLTLPSDPAPQHVTNHPYHYYGAGIGLGGLYGLDNLHPSTVGYGVLARTVCQAITENEGIVPPNPIDLQVCANKDSLLQGPQPDEVNPLIGLENLTAFAEAFVQIYVSSKPSPAVAGAPVI